MSEGPTPERAPAGEPAVVLVSQDIHTFSGSLADDVTMGAPASTVDDQ
ncbi:hypothetical protein FAM23852_001883, partial [Propionibacterium freudenreichii]|nr:hypothetical protein [Propionibacterium freudenreichii]